LRIGVVTVSFNSGRVLGPFLACAFAQTLSDFKLYVVDNASKDDTLAQLGAVRDLRLKVVANRENLGVAEANNQGILAALADSCETVLLLNNDVEFPSDLFVRLYAGLEQHQCEMTTGKMLYFDPPNRIWCAGGWLDPVRLFGAFHYGMGEEDKGQFDVARRVTYAPTCCLLVKRQVFEQIGIMDNKYFVYVDDVDFLYRCFRKSLRLWYLPDARLRHKISALTGGDESEFAIRYMTRNRAYFLRKHLPGWKTLLWTIHFLVITAPKRLLLGWDTTRIWKLRCASVFEGLRLIHD
jgi:GT2 family glycosyltransferase